MKILITGARGFIGSHLGNELFRMGHSVVGVDDLSNPSDNKILFECSRGRVGEWVRLAGVRDYDVIFHLAASINVDESIQKPDKYMINNAFNTVMLLEEIRKHAKHVKLIYASSAEVYGEAKTEIMDENHPLNPQSPYAVSKLAAEQMCATYAKIHDLDVTIIRNFNTFGEHQRGGVYGGVIAKFKAQAKRGEPVTVYGTGQQMRDYMHVSQAVKGYILAMTTRMPLIVNMGSGKPIRIIDIANHIAARFNTHVVHEAARPGEIFRLEADVSLAKLFGYKVETDFWTHLNAFLDV